MELKRETKLAEQILKLDRLRDELYEELLIALGANVHDFLRKLQNNKRGDPSCLTNCAQPLKK